MKNVFSKVAYGTCDINGTTDKIVSAASATNAKCQVSCLDVKVSCFKDYNTPDNPVDISLLTWLSSIKYRSVVDTIRKEPNKETRDKLKALLPAITPSGVFSRRDSKCLVRHSRLIAIDIDYKENSHIGNYGKLKEQIAKIQNVAYCGLSVSGTGYFVIIPIQHPHLHTEHFLAVERAFFSLGIIIDHRCKDVSRLRGYSYDNDPYFNHSAKTFCLTYVEQRPEKIIYASSGSNDAANVESCLNQLHGDITADYGTWFELGCALANAFGEAGREYFHQVSRFHHDYNQIETDQQFDACKRRYDRITLATFFYHFKNVGIYPARALTVGSKRHSFITSLMNEFDLIHTAPTVTEWINAETFLTKPTAMPMLRVVDYRNNGWTSRSTKLKI